MVALLVLILLLDSFLSVLLYQNYCGFEQLRHFRQDLLGFGRKQEYGVESKDHPGPFVFHLVLGMVADELLEIVFKDFVLVGKAEGVGGGQPDESANELRSESSHHFAFELGDVDLAELIDAGVDGLWEFPLVVFEEVDEQGSAAGDVEFPAEIVGWFFVDFACQVEEQLDDVALEPVDLGIVTRQHRTLLDVVAQDRHAPLHHLVVLVRTDRLHDPFFPFGDRQSLQSWPHLFGYSHQIIHDHLVEEPHPRAQLLAFEQVGVEKDEGVLDIVESFLNEDEL